MTRMEEYQTLMEELNQTPPALEYTLTRAKARRARRRFSLPAASLLATLAAFALAVNLSTPFALAVSQVPVLGGLAQLLTFSTSLSAAVEHDYVQPVGLEQTENGITMRVEYLIVDQKQLNIFFFLSSDQYEHLEGQASVLPAETGVSLTGFSVLSGWSGQGNQDLRRIVVDFQDGYSVPEALTLRYTVQTWDTPGVSAEEDLATFTFPLTIDPAYVKNGIVYELNQDLTLDGQTITVTTVEVYPTHLRLNLADHPENTAWLVWLKLSLTDGQGNRFDPVSNGISGTGSPDSPFMTGYRLESPWFYDTEQLNIEITEAKWLDKNMERVEVNLADPDKSQLPEDFTLVSAQRKGNNWSVKFLGPQMRDTVAWRLFCKKYYSPDGTEYEFTQYGSGWEDECWDEASQTYVKQEPRIYQTFSLGNYPYDTVILCPAFSRYMELAQPVTIEVIQ